MKRLAYPSLVALGLLLLSLGTGLGQTVLITNDVSAAGQASYDFGPVTVSAFFGASEVTPNAVINSGNLAFLGVNSSAFPTDANANAINDRDGVLGGADQERLRLEIEPGYYLTNLTWNFSRADGPLPTDGVNISGFSANPGAVFSGGITGTPIYTNGTLTFQITTFDGTVRSVSFTNYTASTNATLEIIVADSTQAGAQLAFRNFTLAEVPPAAPQITTQPVPAVRYEQDGTNLFSVGAFSAGTLSYQWFKSPSSPVAGGTNATLTIPGLVVANAGNYYVVVSNSLGASVTSDTVALTVNAWTAPFFTLNPVSVSAYANQTVNFTALADGSPTWSLNYQWNKGGVPIPGATGTTLTLNNISGADVASYTCTASNGVAPTATSSAASLSLLALPAGSYAAATLTTKPLVYHRYSDVAISTNVFNFGSLGAAGDGDLFGGYSPSQGPVPPNYPNFEAGNPCPLYDAFSSNGRIAPVGQVSNRFTITAWVQSSGAQTPFSGIVYNRSATGSGLFVKKDTSASFDVLAYSWNSLRFGITNDTLALPSGQWCFVALVIEPTQATIYLHDGTNLITQVDTVNHGNGNWSGSTLIGWDSAAGLTDRRFGGQIDEVTLHTRALSASEVYSLYASSTNIPPVIVQSPQGATNYTGQAFGLSVTAQGTLPLTYQWHKQGSGTVAGATNAALTISNPSVGDSGDYFVVVSNAFGGATSGLAAISVVAQPPIITVAPQSQTNWIGLNASFSVTAIGSGPLTYQWAKSGSGALSSQTNATLALSNLLSGDSGDYFVTVTNPEGSSNSPLATLTVLDADLYTQMLFPTNGYTELRTNFGGVIGSTFQMGAFNRSVTHLGYFDLDADGLLESHNVGIFAAGPTPGSGTLLGDVLVPGGTSATYTNGYRWVQLTTPITLTNGQIYVLAASTSAATDFWPGSWSVSWNQNFVGFTSITNRLLRFQGAAAWPTDPGGVTGPSGNSYGAYNLMSVPTTIPSVTLLIEKVGGNVQLTWPQGTLQAAGVVTGPYTNVPSAVSPYSVPATGSNMFFRVKVN